jgi:hypothetical protein
MVASSGWRYAPLLSVIFHGKIRHLSEDEAGSRTWEGRQQGIRLARLLRC